MLHQAIKKEIIKIAKNNDVKVLLIKRSGQFPHHARARFSEKVSSIIIYPSFHSLSESEKRAVILRELGRLIFKRERRRKVKLTLILKHKCERVFFDSEKTTGNSLKLILDLAEEAFAQKFAEHYGADPSIISINSLKSSLSDKPPSQRERNVLRLLREKLRKSGSDFWQSLFALNAIVILLSKKKDAKIKSELIKDLPEDLVRHAAEISNVLESTKRFFEIVRKCAPFVRQELSIILKAK